MTNLTEHTRRRTRRTDKHLLVLFRNLHQLGVLRARDILRQLVERERSDLGQCLETWGEVVDSTPRILDEVDSRVEQDSIEAVSESSDGNGRGEGIREGRELDGASGEDGGVRGDRRERRK